MVVEENQNIKLNLKGCVLEGIGAEIIYNNGTLEIVDISDEGTVIGTGTIQDDRGGAIENSKKLKISGGIVNGWEGGISNKDGGTVEVSGGIITGVTATSWYSYGIYNASGGTVIVSGGVVEGILNKILYPSQKPIWGENKVIVSGGKVSGRIDNSGTVEISRGEVSGGISNKDEGTVEVSGGKISGKYDGIYNDGILTIGIEGGAVSTTNPVIEVGRDGIISNGTFNFYDGVIIGETAIKGDVSHWQEGYVVIVTKEEEKEKAILAMQPEVAKVLISRINEDKVKELDPEEKLHKKETEEGYYYFNSLDMCVKAVKDDNEVTNIEMIRDISLDEAAPTIEIENTKNIILNLNGCLIQKSGDTIIKNKGTLEIVSVSDEGTVIETGEIIQIENEGKLTISSGKIKGNGAYGEAIFNYAEGIVTVSGGTVSGQECGIYNEGTGRVTEEGKFVPGVIVIGGEVSGYKCGIYNKGTGTVTVSKGTVSGVYRGIDNWGTVTVLEEGSVSSGIDNSGTVTVSGGTVSGGIDNSGTVTVSGGAVSGWDYGIYSPSGTLNFYDGVIKGSEAIYGRVVNIPEDKDIIVEVDEEDSSKEKVTLGQAEVARIIKTSDGTELARCGSIINLLETINTVAEPITIEISRDIIIPEGITPSEQETDIIIPEGKNIVLNLNGKIVKGSKKGIIGIEKDATLEVVDSSGTDKGAIRQTAKDESDGYKKAIINKGTFKLTSGKIEGTEEGAILNEGILKIEGGKVIGYNYGIYNSSAGTVTQDGVIVSGVTVSGGIVMGGEVDYEYVSGYAYGIYNSGQGTVKVLAGEVSATSYNDVYGIYNTNQGTVTEFEEIVAGITISGGKVSAEGCFDVYGIYNTNLDKEPEYGKIVAGVIISGGEVSAPSEDSYGIYNSENGIVTIGTKGGEVSTDKPTIQGIERGIVSIGTLNFYDGIIKGRAPIDSYNTINTESGYGVNKYTINSVECAILQREGEEVSVALVGENQYYSNLQEAIDSVSDGVETTIYLLADIEVTEPIVIPEGKIITLDLNGHTITHKEGGTIITNNGTLTILDSTGTVTEIGTVEVTETGTFINQLNQGT